MWLPIKLLGIEPFVSCLNEKLLLAEYMYGELEAKGYQMGPKPDLTVLYFNYVFSDDSEENNSMNRKFLEEILKDGRVFLSSTIINDIFVIRVAILSFRTKLSTVDLCLEVIEEARLKVMAMVRNGAME